jgi:predicted nucleic acid-binding protein
MRIHYLDSSLVIPFTSALLGTRGQKRDSRNIRAVDYIRKTPRIRKKISVATYAETLRHFNGAKEVEALLDDTFGAPRHARRWARLQNRSGRVMGDNDAWIAAQAVEEGGVVVGHDGPAFRDRPDVEYIDFLKA